jgi:hypothetical protein
VSTRTEPEAAHQIADAPVVADGEFLVEQVVIWYARHGHTSDVAARRKPRRPGTHRNVINRSEQSAVRLAFLAFLGYPVLEL